MNTQQPCHLMVADVGNSAIKLGRFLVSTDADRSPGRLDLQLDGVYPTVVSTKRHSFARSQRAPARASRGGADAVAGHATAVVCGECESHD